jgi:ClpP class serine protease
MGSQALNNGLIDEIGGFDRAIAMVKKSAGLAEADLVTLVPYPPPKTLLELLLGQDSMETGAAGEIFVRDSRVAKFFRERLGEIPGWQAMLEGGMMRVSPYWVTVQ